MAETENGGKRGDALPVPALGQTTIQRRMIAWTPEGLPVPVSVPMLSKAGIEELATAALSLPYKIEPLALVDIPASAPPELQSRLQIENDAAEKAYEAELEFQGMTNAEVMIVKLARAAARGDKDATASMLDRVLGKPKQSVESKSMKLTYEDYLKEMARTSVLPSADSVVEPEVGHVDVDIVADRGISPADPGDGLDGLV
jgi:hypothetical protein